MSRIPYLDLRRLHESIRPDLDAAYESILESSTFVSAAAGETFEREFARAHGATHAVGCGSGTDALALALRALGVGPGDEVVVPALTFIATAEAVVHVGAEPVLADVDPETLLVTAASVRAVATPRTRVVIPVHLHGRVVDLDDLEALKAEGYLIIEDAAQAHLATWRGRSIGSVGHLTCFSFFPGKNLGALGDAGAVLGNDAELIAQIRRLRDHGRETKDLHEAIGWCSRLDGIQAGFLAAKLRHLPAWTKARQALGDLYRAQLAGTPGVRLVPWDDGAVHHALVVRVAERDRVAEVLEDHGIGTGVHYRVALSNQPALRKWATSSPNAEQACDEVLSLPCDPLMTADEVGVVVDALRRAVGASSDAR